MKTTIVIAVWIALFFSISLSAQDVDEIIAKNLEIRGGVEKLKSLNSMKITAKGLQMGLEFPVIIYTKRPNKMRLEVQVQGMTMIEAFDGETAWFIRPFQGDTTAQKKSEEETKRAEEDADFDGHLMDYKAKGHKVEYLGEDEFEGTPVFKLKVTLKSGNVVTYFLDKEYYIELKTDTKITRGEQEFYSSTIFGDYQEVDGIMTAHSMKQLINGNLQFEAVVEKVEFNVEMDDAMFVMPAEKKEEQ